MKKISFIITSLLIVTLTSCSEDKLEEKGFQVRPATGNAETDKENDLNSKALKIEMRPSNVLLTGIQNVRITPIYKVNTNKEDNSTFIGSTSFHYTYDDFGESVGNNWNDNLMPGFSAAYGYNMMNVSHYDINSAKQRNFFEKPVLIRTVYYPTFSKDTLNANPITRDYFMVTVYNEDTNNDGFINLKDLRRMYLFNLKGEKLKALIPENYSVFKSEYDPENDFMYVFAYLDKNKNGQTSPNEPTHIFWIDLKNPTRSGRMY